MTIKKSIKNRLLGLILTLITVLTIIPASTAQASGEDDGLGHTINSSHTVYSSASTATPIGTIYAKETFTILNSYGNFYHIEYSTSSGTKEGYVQKSSDIGTGFMGTYVSTVLSTATVYYGPNSSSYEVAGTVYSGEKVVVLAVGSSWNMIEYNSPSGRKRGYVLQSNLSWGTYRFKSMSGLPVFDERNPKYINISSSKSVRSGPTGQFPVIGSVDSSDNPIIYAKTEGIGQTYYYIRYKVNSSGKYKTGYIIP